MVNIALVGSNIKLGQSAVIVASNQPSYQGTNPIHKIIADMKSGKQTLSELVPQIEEQYSKYAAWAATASLAGDNKTASYNSERATELGAFLKETQDRIALLKLSVIDVTGNIKTDNISTVAGAWTTANKTVPEITAHIKTLNDELDKLVYNSDAYNKKFAEIDKLNKYIKPDTKEVKTGKDAEIEAKRNLLTQNQLLDLEAIMNLKHNISELGSELEKRNGVIKQAYEKEIATATILRDAAIQKENDLLKNATKEKPYTKETATANIGLANNAFNKVRIKADQDLADASVKLTEDMDKEKLAFDQKYLALTKELEKDKYDQAIRDYSLSVSDYESYLNVMLDLKIKNLEDINKEIEKNNKEHPDNKKTPIDITEQRTIGATEIKAKSVDYSQKQKEETLSDWKKQNELLVGITSDAAASIANVLSSEWGNAWTKMFGEANSVIEKIGQAITEKIINRLLDKGVTSLLDIVFGVATGGASVLAGGIGGGGLLGGSFNLASGGSFIVPPGYPNDTFRANLTSGETVNVTPAGQTNNSLNNNFDASGIIKSIQVLNMNMINQNNRNKLPGTIGIEGKAKGSDLLFINNKAAKQRSRYGAIG